MSRVGDFFSAWRRAMNARDAVGIASLCTEDVVWEDSVLMGAGPLRGRAAVRDFFEEYLFRPFPDLRFEILELIGSGDGTGAAERARFSGTFLAPVSAVGLAPTGQLTEFEVAAFFEFREGKATRVRVIVDMLNIAREAGAAPASGIDRRSCGYDVSTPEGVQTSSASCSPVSLNDRDSVLRPALWRASTDQCSAVGPPDPSRASIPTL